MNKIKKNGIKRGVWPSMDPVMPWIYLAMVTTALGSISSNENVSVVFQEVFQLKGKNHESENTHQNGLY